MTINKRHRVLCVGAGNMGRAHALAYHRLDGFEIVGICTRKPESRKALIAELGTGYPEFNDYTEALAKTQPDAVCIATYPDTHFAYAKQALEAGCHVFVEKPLAETIGQAEKLVSLAKKVDRKLVVGYILRHHPSWKRFVETARTLGKPLVMRMNLNQQSSGKQWQTHLNLLSSISPVVDCGVHYVDVMCQMTQSRPVRVSGIGARLSGDLPDGKINYAQLQVTFADGSVGWYEAGWGPMMSEAAFFIKDVIGPRGSLSIVANKAGASGESANVEAHTGTQSLQFHHSALNADGEFQHEDEWIPMESEPDHDALFQLEQEYFLKTLDEDLDVTDLLQAACNASRIVLAADESFRTGKTIEL
ncbi:Gfo/Idh/MocA family oxidoreductase [Rubellicoccus peritrichatus]|uniref:Gfo/Idh/MocA family oxidoreductase n=1 Tax=Rubellicoccus peritrichatus TaxID=3080537 RepID=A0AAQ3LCR4_9BACT|nr:Gfo/Idh/MocA family oxidoreductase [Puniceicoccus sp. CR14]WOO39544.1 Gfo/Idh/MocA family oxidoreductase [Puniceicoccus sp. CR14]